MKGRDSRKQTIITAAAAITGGAIAGTIIGVTAVTPFIFTKGSEFASEAIEKARAKHAAGMPAAKAAKADLDKLKKEEKKLNSDKKALEKKKKAARKAQAKKIYEERVANGYEASIALIDSESYKAVNDAGKFDMPEPKKKKQKKAKQPTVVAVPKTEKEIAAELAAETAAEVDYQSSGSMFKGISF